MFIDSILASCATYFSDFSMRPWAMMDHGWLSQLGLAPLVAASSGSCDGSARLTDVCVRSCLQKWGAAEWLCKPGDAKFLLIGVSLPLASLF